MPGVDRFELITSAAPSFEEQLASRKRRYATLMGGRVVLLVLAAAAYGLSPWLAVGLIALSVPLPWMAVLIANDAPARRSEDAHRFLPAAPARQVAPLDVPRLSAGPGCVERDDRVTHR